MELFTAVLAALIFATPTSSIDITTEFVAPVPIGNPYEPTFNLSAIRSIQCGKSYGSGFLIGDGIIATAAHVAELKGCVDGATRKPLKTYKIDPEADFALMSGDIPHQPVFTYDCSRYVGGKVYSAYGISPFAQPFNMARSVSVRALGINVTIQYEDGSELKDVARLSGYTVHGQSGAPIVDIEAGKVIGIVNAGQDTIFGFPTGLMASRELRDTFLCKQPS